MVKTRLELDSVTVALSWCDRVYVGDIRILHDNATNSVFRLLFLLLFLCYYLFFRKRCDVACDGVKCWMHSLSSSSIRVQADEPLGEVS